MFTALFDRLPQGIYGPAGITAVIIETVLGIRLVQLNVIQFDLHNFRRDFFHCHDGPAAVVMNAHMEDQTAVLLDPGSCGGHIHPVGIKGTGMGGQRHAHSIAVSSLLPVSFSARFLPFFPFKSLPALLQAFLKMYISHRDFMYGLCLIGVQDILQPELHRVHIHLPAHHIPVVL